MKKMKKTTQILLVGNVMFAALLAIQVTHRAMQPKTSVTWMPSWQRIGDFDSATELADSVVTAKVVKIRKGALRIKAEGLPGNQDVIPAEVITMQVLDDDVKGKKKKGQTFQLFHTGSSGEQGDAAQISVEDAPPYRVGETYMLMTKEAGPNINVGGGNVKTQAVVSPEGRWKITSGNKVEPASSLGWAKQLRQKPLKEMRERAAKAHANAKAGRGKLKRQPNKKR